MKKMLLAVIIISLIIVLPVSCRQDSAQDPSATQSDTPPVIVTPVEKIDIYRPPTTNLQVFKYQDDWEKAMKDIYGVEIKIHNISPLYQTDIPRANYYPQAIANGSIKGLIEIKSWEIGNLPVLKELGLILPLDEYLKDNDTYQSLPGAMRNAFIMPDGQTWALATSSPFGLFSRKIKKEWLDNLKMPLPQNLDELYEMSKSFAYDDPNGNGISDEHGMDIITYRGARMLLDVFLANDCYLSNYASSSIGFDYSTDAYEDAILKPGMLESLRYIKSLNDEGILIQNPSADFLSKGTSGNFLELSLNYDYRRINIEDWHEIYSYSDTSNSVMGIRPYKCFVMTSNTDNPEQTINIFVNAFLSDIYGLANGNFGIEGVNYTYEDNTLTNHFAPEGNDLSHYTEENIGLVHFNLNMIIDNNITLIDPEWTDISIPGAFRETNLYNDFYNKGNLFFDSDFMLHNDFKKVQDKFAISFGDFLANIDSVSPEDFIAEYINNAKLNGWQEILNDLNNESGKVSSYSYD